ncbi:MAG: FxsA family protein [Dehalococcoidia bacterium]|nr:MAG: FxsA family protein [Dehalococcoidia bacterium]
MLLRLALLFVLTPLVELAILVYLGTIIGALYTILIVVATGILGAFMARNQGLAALSRIRGSIERGIIPSDEIFDGALILVGGLLLLAPGVITDVIGFAVLVPQTRRIIGRWLRGLIRRRIQRGEIRYWEVQ